MEKITLTAGVQAYVVADLKVYNEAVDKVKNLTKEYQSKCTIANEYYDNNREKWDPLKSNTYDPKSAHLLEWNDLMDETVVLERRVIKAFEDYKKAVLNVKEHFPKMSIAKSYKDFFCIALVCVTGLGIAMAGSGKRDTPPA